MPFMGLDTDNLLPACCREAVSSVNHWQHLFASLQINRNRKVVG